MAQIIDLFGGEGSGMGDSTGGSEIWTSSEVAAKAQEFMGRMADGEVFGEDSDLLGFLSCISQLHDPNDEQMPGVKYDEERNEITIPWKR